MNKICKTLISFLLGVLIFVPAKAQIAYSPFLDSITQLADHNSILLLTRQLAGDTSVIVNGLTQTITSRHYQNAHNAIAADFISEKFEELGYLPEIHTFNNGRGENIIATKIGTRYPEKEFIICGHYDNMPSGSTAPGADDNASGTVAVLEAARLLRDFDFDYTLRFATWDEEEIGLVGSHYYALRASNQGQQILGVLNLDMIAWDSDDDYQYSIATNSQSQPFVNDFLQTTAFYQPQLFHNYHYTTASDHASFWDYNYPAMLAIEDWDDFNAYYHTPADDIDILNMDYYVSFVRAAIANIAAQAWDQRIGMLHDPVVSGNSTGPREAILVLNSTHAVDTTVFLPRLYYSNDGIVFNHVQPYQHIADTFRFTIPGMAFGSDVYYYFAVQDEPGRMIATLPAGGKGINPPGTTHPDNFFSYTIDNISLANQCSANTPLIISDNQNTIDQFEVNIPGAIMDLDVNLNITHSRTGDLRLILTGPDGTACLLSDRIGGDGDNYSNTTFDDEAEMSISGVSAPFTGRFRPQMSLGNFNDKPISGIWKFKVNDNASGNTGTLDNWCLQMLYFDPTIDVEIMGKSPKEFLSQNYPNPMSYSTSISFRLTEPSVVSLRVFNLYGQEVAELASGRFDAGNHLLVTNLGNLAPGQYFYTLQTGRFSQTRSLVVIR